MKTLKAILEFFLCLLEDNCPYSIKKFLSYAFSILVFYVVIFTNKEYYELLGFVAILLGLRSYDKKSANNAAITNSPPAENEKEIL